MLNNPNSWEKLGRIALADSEIPWMKTWTGPSFLAPTGKGGLFDIYITGRDEKNRSRIGKAPVDLGHVGEIFNIQKEPLLGLGELGCFDENGVSYPAIVNDNDKRFMYYVGWMPSVMTPFLNFGGLAVSEKGSEKYDRISRAPILERTNEEPFSNGSVFVLKEDKWKMWYTSFLKWGNKEAGEHLHYYVIKYAESDDGIHWNRTGKICIDIADPAEYAICKPSVYKHNGLYHMWYTYRGEQYRIGYAWSENGTDWNRRDDLVAIDVSPTGWDSIAMSYAHVVSHNGYLYMVYCGNQYGKEGLGLARLKMSNN
jgi:hypothetical protein